MSSDDHVSDAARLPGGEPDTSPVDPQDLPEHLAAPTTMPSTGPAVAEAAIKAIGGKPRADAMVDVGGDLRVDVLCLEDAPAPGWRTWSTVSLHTQPNEIPLQSGESTDIRAELLTVGQPGSDVMGKVLGSCSFAVLQDHWIMAPGIVFGDVVAMYAPDTTTPHIMWCHPFTAQGLDAVEVDGTRVHWLMGVPVSEAERVWLDEHGFDAFVDLLDEKKVNYSDLQRPSVV